MNQLLPQAGRVASVDQRAQEHDAQEQKEQAQLAHEESSGNTLRGIVPPGWAVKPGDAPPPWQGADHGISTLSRARRRV